MPTRIRIGGRQKEPLTGAQINSVQLAELLRAVNRPRNIRTPAEGGFRLGAELIKALALAKLGKNAKANEQAAFQEFQQAAAPEQTDFRFVQPQGSQTLQGSTDPSSLPSGEFGSFPDRQRLAGQIDAENQAPRPLALSERLGQFGAPLSPNSQPQTPPQLTRSRGLSEIAGRLQHPLNQDLARQLQLSGIANQQAREQGGLDFQRQLALLGLKAQQAKNLKQLPPGRAQVPGVDLPLTGSVAAQRRNIRQPFPVAGRDKPLPENVQNQRLQIAQAEKESLNPLQEKQLQKLGREEQQAERKIQTSFNSFQRKSDNLVGTIDKALEQINAFSAGAGGFLLNNLPASDSRDLSATLDTIRANVGFEELQAMRDNSQTGGALGQVSEMENRLLQSVQASLDQFQSAGQLRQNLNTIKQLAEAVKLEKSTAFNADFGGLPAIESKSRQNRRKEDTLTPEEEAELEQLRRGQQ